jgi:hypothetical protein
MEKDRLKMEMKLYVSLFPVEYFLLSTSAAPDALAAINRMQHYPPSGVFRTCLKALSSGSRYVHRFAADIHPIR